MNTQSLGLVKCEEASCGEGKLPRFWEIEEQRRLSKCADHCQSDIAFWPWLNDIGNKWGTLGAVLEPEGFLWALSSSLCPQNLVLASWNCVFILRFPSLCEKTFSNFSRPNRKTFLGLLPCLSAMSSTVPGTVKEWRKDKQSPVHTEKPGSDGMGSLMQKL